MRDPKRMEPFLNKIKEQWEKVPDWRFGQLMMNFMLAKGDPFYLEEDEFIKDLEKYLDGQ